MTDVPSNEPEEVWKPTPPFSQRPSATPLPQTPKVIVPEEHAPAGVTPRREEPPTLPLSFLAKEVNEVPAGFRVLTPEELTPEELRQVNLQITAHYYALKYADTRPKVKVPEVFMERFYVWKMIYQEILAVLITAVVIRTILFVADMLGGFSPWTLLWLAGGLVMAAFAIYRTYHAWRITYFYSDAEETGLKRPRVRWLFLKKIDETEATSSIITKKVRQNYFTSTFNLNSWQITLDTAAQEDPFLDIGFVRDGERLRATVSAWQRYLNQVRG